MAEQQQQTADGIDAREAARRAVAHVTEMTGQPPEVVSSLEPDEDGGWLVTVELLELARVPDTTDVLGCYQVRIGTDGNPREYRRVRRYYRGRVGEELQ